MGSERRFFNRLVVSLPVRYSIPEKGEEFSGLGVLRNISLSGLYFECPPPVNLEKGQILHLSIAASLPSLEIHSISHLEVKGKIIRLAPPARSGRSWGVAVRFLEELTFSAPPAE